MTIGISPKVALPALLQLVAGVALVIVGLVAGDTTVRDAGLAAIGAAGITGAAGYAAPAGAIQQPDVGPASDELLPEDAKQRLGLAPPPS